MPSGACVVRYEGARGVVWRIKYADADGKQVMETVGAERDSVTRKHAEAELRERLAASNERVQAAEDTHVRRARVHVVRGRQAVARMEAPDDAAALERRLGVECSGRKSP